MLTRTKRAKKVAVNFKTFHPDGPVDACSCTTDVQDFPLTHFDAFTLSKGILSSLTLAVSLASLETAIGTATVIDLLKIIQDHNFDAQVLNIQVESIACSQNISDRIVKKHKQYCDAHCILDS